MKPVLRTEVGLALGAVVVLGAFFAGVAVAHIAAPAWERFSELIWGAT